jgi:hypothetical protein
MVNMVQALFHAVVLEPVDYSVLEPTHSMVRRCDVVSFAGSIVRLQIGR